MAKSGNCNNNVVGKECMIMLEMINLVTANVIN